MQAESTYVPMYVYKYLLLYFNDCCCLLHKIQYLMTFDLLKKIELSGKSNKFSQFSKISYIFNKFELRPLIYV